MARITPADGAGRDAPPATIPTAVAEVPGIPGTELTPEMVQSLPEHAPPAPWRLRATGLAWLAPPSHAAGAALQPGVTGTPLVAGGIFVSYEQTPVGPYDEIIAFVVLRRQWSVAAHIPFIAVDSAASVIGGRANWSLPKTLAAFSGHPVRDGAMHARHDGWEVEARARALGPALPARARFSLVQAGADGREAGYPGRARLRVRPALVRVRTRGTTALTGWLRGGRYPGILIEEFAGELGRERP